MPYLLEPFARRMGREGLFPLRPTRIDTLQINVGKLCNQTCTHCHVDAGPHRKEIMTRETMESCLDLLDRSEATTVDLTGGAPEMVPHFRWLVEEIHRRGRKIIDRCNLTILTVPSYQDLPEFFAKHEVEVVSSLPCYSKKNTDEQRGDGVFDRSIRALKRLNEVGYGRQHTLTLVYNPIGAFLPPPQEKLETDYHRELKELFGIEFTHLYTITNMPIARFLEFLKASHGLEAYMEKLVRAFNPAAAKGVMCRNTLSVSWDGYLYDCDFNQMLDMKIQTDGRPLRVEEADWELLHSRSIQIDQHCYGCTAGSGSSCGGKTA